MKRKPSWGLWLALLLCYTALDMLIEFLLHNGVAWSQLPGALEDSLFGATLTWLFALYRWYKAESSF